MKKYILCTAFLFIFSLSEAFSGVPHTTLQTEYEDTSLMPDFENKKIFLAKTEALFPVNTCYQDYTRIPKELHNGMECKEILKNLSLMGGGVRYYDTVRKRYVPIFKECRFTPEKNELYIKDKNFGKMYCSTDITTDSQKCSMNATLCKPLANPMFWEIRKNEFTIFVLTNDTPEFLELYIVIKTSYKIGFLFRSRIENAFQARINGMQDWFVRMYTRP